VRIARIFNTYGPRMHENDGRVVSNFVVQALAGQPLTVFGDGRGACALAEGRSGSSRSEYHASARAAAVHSLLDPAKPTMTIDSVSRAAVALGARLEMKVVPSRTPARPPSRPRRKGCRDDSDDG
jgi:UDP-glucuronate decarboxylase